MNNKKIIVSGHTGFLGENLVPNLNKDNLLFCNRYSFEDKNKPVFFDIKNKPISIFKIFQIEVVLLHLATHYSTSKSDNEKIYSANIVFGEKILSSLSNVNLKKIVYTNTMFNFYENEKLSNSYYSETKKQFSEILKSYTASKSINYEEIYLDNTFGEKDKRKKIISEIARCILNNEQNPIKNPDNQINILYVRDIVSRLKLSIENSASSGISAFIGKESYLLSSIYDFLSEYNKTKNMEIDLLTKVKNYYTKDMPKIDYKNIKLHDVPAQLTMLI